jgi:hypothetical protein
MQHASRFFKISPILLLILLIIVASANTAVETYAQGATATGAATVAATIPPASAFALCLPPPPTPGATEAAPAATAAATAAAPAPTAVAAATQAATAPARTARPTSTPRMTAIPKGRRPAVAGITLSRDGSVARDGGECLKVVDVQRGGPGAAAGIKRGDYILGFDANLLAKLENFSTELRKHVSGDVVTLTVQSGQQVNQIKLTLGLGR